MTSTCGWMDVGCLTARLCWSRLATLAACIFGLALFAIFAILALFFCLQARVALLAAKAPAAIGCGVLKGLWWLRARAFVGSKPKDGLVIVEAEEASRREKGSGKDKLKGAVKGGNEAEEKRRGKGNGKGKGKGEAIGRVKEEEDGGESGAGIGKWKGDGRAAENGTAAAAAAAAAAALEEVGGEKRRGDWKVRERRTYGELTSAEASETQAQRNGRERYGWHATNGDDDDEEAAAENEGGEEEGRELGRAAARAGRGGGEDSKQEYWGSGVSQGRGGGEGSAAYNGGPGRGEGRGEGGDLTAQEDFGQLSPEDVWALVDGNFVVCLNIEDTSRVPSLRHAGASCSLLGSLHPAEGATSVRFSVAEGRERQTRMWLRTIYAPLANPLPLDAFFFNIVLEVC
eukprot:jgi/Mesen1/8181/ME000044S07447